MFKDYRRVVASVTIAAQIFRQVRSRIQTQYAMAILRTPRTSVARFSSTFKRRILADWL